MTERYDCVIIGAGPAGLSAAIEASNAGLRCILIDKGTVADGIRHYQRNMSFFSTPEMLEIGGIPFVVPTTRPTSLDCVNYYRRVAEHFGLQCIQHERIESIRKGNGIFRIHAASGREYHAANAVIATGYFDTPNLLCVAGENLPHVTHYYSDPLPFYRRRVLIVGGKNSAVEAALDLWRHGALVTVVHRGEALSQGIKYWILPDFQNRVAAGSIDLRYQTVVEEFRPGMTIVNRKGVREEIHSDAVFILTGYRIDTGFLHSAGVRYDPDTLEPVHDPATMETNIAGLFVAGGLVGGRLNNKVFIENGRGHGRLIVAAIIARRQSRYVSGEANPPESSPT